MKPQAAFNTGSKPTIDVSKKKKAVDWIEETLEEWNTEHSSSFELWCVVLPNHSM